MQLIVAQIVTMVLCGLPANLAYEGLIRMAHEYKTGQTHHLRFLLYHLNSLRNAGGTCVVNSIRSWVMGWTKHSM